MAFMIFATEDGDAMYARNLLASATIRIPVLSPSALWGKYAVATKTPLGAVGFSPGAEMG